MRGKLLTVGQCAQLNINLNIAIIYLSNLFANAVARCVAFSKGPPIRQLPLSGVVAALLVALLVDALHLL